MSVYLPLCIHFFPADTAQVDGVIDVFEEDMKFACEIRFAIDRVSLFFKFHNRDLCKGLIRQIIINLSVVVCYSCINCRSASCVIKTQTVSIYLMCFSALFHLIYFTPSIWAHYVLIDQTFRCRNWRLYRSTRVLLKVNNAGMIPIFGQLVWILSYRGSVWTATKLISNAMTWRHKWSTIIYLRRSVSDQFALASCH